MGSIRLREFPVQKINALLQLPDLQSKMKRTRVYTCLLHKTKVRRVPAEFNIGAMCSSLQSSLGDLKRGALVSQGLLEGLDVLLLVIDLLHGFAEVRLELVVSIVGLCDSLLERHVRVVPVAPHLVRALRGGNK